jgi:hypothetical protein
MAFGNDSTSMNLSTEPYDSIYLVVATTPEVYSGFDYNYYYNFKISPLSYEIIAITEDISLCSGEDYTYPDGTTETNITTNTSHESILTSVVTGRDSTITTNIQVNSVDVSVIVNENTLTANETNADAYQWINCDLNSFIGGETDYTFVATETGNYSVIIEDNNCIDTSACNSIIILAVENTEKIVQSIWPNPTSGQINIRLAKNNTPVVISIFDITGKIVLQKEIDINQTYFSTIIPGMSGVYVVQLKSNLKTASFKISKK